MVHEPSYDGAEYDGRVLHIAQGSRDDLSALYEKLKKPLFLFALSILGDYAAAEDAVQDTFVALMNHAGQYRRGTNARAWLFTIARNHCLNELKKRRSEPLDEQKPDGAPGPEDVASSAANFLRLLAPLDEMERQLLALRFSGGLNHRQAAEVLGVTPAAARKRYARAIQKLRVAQAGCADG